MARKGRNAAAFERTVASLRNAGRLEPVDAAAVALGRTLAELLDNKSESPSHTTWAYLGVIRALRGEVTPSAVDDDDLKAFLAVLSAQVGDAKES